MITLCFTYDEVDEESTEAGDFRDHGFYEPGGWKFPCYDDGGELNEYDRPQWERPGDLRSAIESARDLGICEASSSPPVPGDWWTSVDPDIDYASGIETRYSFHVDGCTPSTWHRIHRLLTN